MGRFDLDYLAQRGKDFFRSLRSLSQGAAPSLRPLLNHLPLAGYLTAALVGGQLAQRYSEHQALAAWHAENPPPLDAWKGVMRGYGLSAVESLDRRARLARTLPIQMEAPGQAWVQAPGGIPVIAIFVAAEPTAFFFSREENPKAKAGEWAPLGPGWDAMPEAIEFLKRNPAPPKVEKSEKKPGQTGDAREIRY
ncbi:MAG: hypothetical protein AB7P04_02710 [Bacteriovoracia bacterium]